MPTLNKSMGKSTILLICPYCRKPLHLPVKTDASTTVWLLKCCPACLGEFGPAFPGEGIDKWTVSDLIEWVGMEVYNAVRLDPKSRLLHFWPTKPAPKPLTAEFFTGRQIKRQGIPLDILSWIAMAAASGVVAGLAYDVLKRVIQSALRRGTATLRSTKLRLRTGEEFEEHWVKLCREEIEMCISGAIRYSRKRLTIVRRNVSARGRFRPSSAKHL